MQTPRLPLPAWTFPAIVLCLALVTARAAQSSAATNAAPATPEPPKSIFRVPTSPRDGRDPFFPQSTLRVKTVVTTATNVPVAIAELELKGISGSAGRRLAIINNRTFEPGEEGTVISNLGRIRITCKEINADSVRVILNGQERTLTLRPR